MSEFLTREKLYKKLQEQFGGFENFKDEKQIFKHLQKTLNVWSANIEELEGSDTQFVDIVSGNIYGAFGAWMILVLKKEISQISLLRRRGEIKPEKYFNKFFKALFPVSGIFVSKIRESIWNDFKKKIL